jgi:hypothetical protein
VYFFVLVDIGNQKAFAAALSGTAPFDLSDHGSVVASGKGTPPAGLKEELLATHKEVLFSEEGMAAAEDKW